MARLRDRRPARPARKWLLLGVTASLVAVSAGAWQWWQHYEQRHVAIRFAGEGVEVPALDLTFFPEQFAFAAPSPPPPIGAETLDAAELTIGEELCPERSVVRYQGVGVGAGFAYVQLGKPIEPIVLRPPMSLTGRVGEPVHYWCMGWRCAGYRPVADAEVVVMGGGEHGVDLARARTDERGEFTVTGFDGRLDALGLRVRAQGFELVHERVSGLEDRDGARALITMTRSPVRRGRVEVAPELDLAPDELLLLARGLPGVQARPDPSGALAFDHVPPDVEARVLVYDLPPLVAQTSARTERDGAFEVRVLPGAVVKGRVLGDDLQPKPGALVWIGQQTAVRTDEHGRFELPNQLPGPQRITAQWKPKRRRAKPWLATKKLTLAGGQVLERVELLLER